MTSDITYSADYDFVPILEQVEVAGNTWLHMGVHGGRDIWVSVQNNNYAYVAIYSQPIGKRKSRSKYKGWVLQKREWVKTKNSKYTKLKITKLKIFGTLLEAQQSIALLEKPGDKSNE